MKVYKTEYTGGRIHFIRDKYGKKIKYTKCEWNELSEFGKEQAELNVIEAMEQDYLDKNNKSHLYY